MESFETEEPEPFIKEVEAEPTSLAEESDAPVQKFNLFDEVESEQATVEETCRN